MSATALSFDDTARAFAYKSDRELRKAAFLFSSMRYPWLVNTGLKLTPWAINSGLPVKGLIRNTLFAQFVGGETLEETSAVAATLKKFKVDVILDYGVEGKEGEDNFDHACEEFMRVIRYAGSQPNTPFMSIKVTGLARFALLEKLDAAAGGDDGARGIVHLEVLNEEEKAEWDRVVARMQKICSLAASVSVGVLVDAEETWIQDPIDALATQMMEQYNGTHVIVYNTVQLYRHDRLQFLYNSVAYAQKRGFMPGLKLVRGAYMEKERRRAEEKGYPSPIQPSQEATHRDYDAAIGYCMDHIESLGLIVASHNEQSNLWAARLMDEKGIRHDHPHVHFSQLYGMSDNITFNLAGSGFSVSKYLPFGPIRDVIPYLMRRAQENSSVAGQTGRELGLIRKELSRRKK